MSMDGFAARSSLLLPAAAALLASCLPNAGNGTDADSSGDGDPNCDREITPIVTYAVDEAAGCVDFSPDGEVVIGCRAEADLVMGLQTCYRNTGTGQLVFSFSLYPHVDPGWSQEMSCGYTLPDDACP